MEDLQEQLALLRRRIARIDRKYADVPAPDGTATARARVREPAPVRYQIEDVVSGEVVTTPLGEHFETERLWGRHRRHGSVDISGLDELPHDLLDSLSDGAIPS